MTGGAAMFRLLPRLMALAVAVVVVAVAAAAV